MLNFQGFFSRFSSRTSAEDPSSVSVDIRDPTSTTNNSDEGGDAGDDNEEAVTNNDKNNQNHHYSDLVSTESTVNGDLSDDKAVNDYNNAGKSDVSLTTLSSGDRNYGSCQLKQETPEQSRQVVTDWKDS